MFNRFSFALMLLLTVSLARVDAALINGSFEDLQGTFATANEGVGSANAPQLLLGSTKIPGWTVVNAELAWIKTGAFAINSSHLDKFLDLAGYTDNVPHGGVLQNIAGLTAGNSYQLLFDVGAYSSQTAVVKAIVAGSDVGNFTSISAGTVVWTTHSLTFVAATATVSVELTGVSSTGDFIGLDHVQLNDLGPSGAVPEPASMAIWGLGALGCAVAGYRRRKVA